MYNIIDKKRLRQALTKEEIDWVVSNYVSGIVSDAEMSSLLMAICLNGMNDTETYYLTKAMQASGKTIKFSYPTVDKHSTGGVSDSTTLVLTPLLASMGIRVAKMSGRGLGTTGGTIDKLEVFKGYDVYKSFDEFNRIIKETGASIIAQSADIATADKKIYALRDKTATVASIPLIASSVMSKKLAMGSNIILLDVKYGKGAFMQNKRDAIRLAKLMVKIGKLDNKKVWAVISNMNVPLAEGVGCAQEVYSVIKTIDGEENNLKKISIELATNLYMMAKNVDRAAALSEVNIAFDKGIKDKLKQIVNAHGGATEYIDNPDKLLESKYVTTINASESGYISDIDALNVARFVMELKQRVDNDKYRQGIISNVSVGDRILAGDKLVTIYSDTKISVEDKDAIRTAYTITNRKPKKLKLIEKVIK